MLLIRNAQLAAFEAIRWREFEDSLLGQVERHWPQWAAGHSAENRRAFIRRAVQRARTFDIAVGRDFRRFVNLSLLLGEGFESSERYPWAGAFLNAPGVPASTRVDQLTEYVRDLLRAGRL